jgi:hypothetical protein
VNRQKNNVTVFIEQWPSLIGLILIGFYSFGAAVFYRQFAHLHIQLPQLSFPIFISEITLFLCGVLFLINWRINKFKLTKWNLAVCVYFVWVLLKAFEGYHEYGALAFRNAALYYYPLFVVFGYYFYRIEFFSNKLVIFLLTSMLVSKFFISLSVYCVLPYIFLSLVLLFQLQIKNRLIFFVILAVIIYTPPSLYLSKSFTTLDFFFYSSRNRVLGHIASFVFLFCIYFLGFLKMKTRYKNLWCLLALVIIGLGLLKYADPNALKSVINIQKVREGFRDYEFFINERRQHYSMEPLTPRLYSPEKIEFGGTLQKHLRRYNVSNPQQEKILLQDLSKIYVNIVIDQTTKTNLEKEESWNNALEKIEALVNGLKKREVSRVSLSQIGNIFTHTDSKVLFDKNEIHDRIGSADWNVFEQEIREIEFEYFSMVGLLDRNNHMNIENGVKQAIKAVGREEELTFDEIEAIYNDNVRKPRDIDTAFNNIYFRLFIWSDMFKEMLKENAWLGINFGKPQRSESIEILGWASTEWRSDGWITPHNSFLHIIYRGGIVGVAFLIGLVSIVIYLIFGFIRIKCLPGIFLMTIFVYWMTIANFLVFLEFPYNAIHFWSLLGMTLAFYQDQLKRVKAEK